MSIALIDIGLGERNTAQHLHSSSMGNFLPIIIHHTLIDSF
jgi:hypothetical protein